MSITPEMPISYLETHADEPQALLEQLCGQPSVAAQNLGIAAMADLVEKLLSATGFSTQRLTVEDAPPVIYGELRGRGPYTLLLYNHYDVQVTVFASCEPVATPLNDPFVQKIATIAGTFAGKPASITPIVGGTLPLLGGLRRYIGLSGLCAPGNVSYWGSAAHAPNENIRLTDLQRAVRYNCYMFQALGG